MKDRKKLINLVLAATLALPGCCVVCSALLPGQEVLAARTVPAPPQVTEKNGVKEIVFDFSGETVGAPPATFTAAVGNWIIGRDGDNTVLVVDGSKWKRGVASAGLADKARALYGERYAEFLDNVTAYAYYPFAVANTVDNFTSGSIDLRFKAIAGRIDQGAGILFDLKPNGDYYALRANPLENNLVLWRYKHGRRSSVEWVRNVVTPSRKWHTLKLTVDGRQIKGYVNGKQYLGYRLDAPVSGRVGLWTKADSVVYFDDYRVRMR
jgi:ABC-type amino acid transport substrate-binding protein